jgi:hypothetical protein
MLDAANAIAAASLVLPLLSMCHFAAFFICAANN